MHFLLLEDSIGVALPRGFYAAKQFPLDFSFFRANSIKNILILLSVKGICPNMYAGIKLFLYMKLQQFEQSIGM